MNINLQLEVIEGGATDAASVHNVKRDTFSTVCVATRYIHSTVGVAHVDDN